jgi:hypothetical protein
MDTLLRRELCTQRGSGAPSILLRVHLFVPSRSASNRRRVPFMASPRRRIMQLEFESTRRRNIIFRVSRAHWATWTGRINRIRFDAYEGSPLFALPLLKPGDAPASPLYEDLYRPGATASVSLTVRSLSRLFEYSLAISAWKQAGEVRWALRSNPSSGNLHPTEAYLLIDDVAGLSQGAGLYHYAAKEQALELRARWPPSPDDLAALCS